MIIESVFSSGEIGGEIGILKELFSWVFGVSFS